LTRITQNILYSRTLADIRRSLGSRVTLQQQIASGLRVNRPSDDPAATLRILPLTADLRDLGQLRDNSRLARETIDTGAANLEDASQIMQRVRELTVQAANGTINESDRRSLGQEVDQLLQQMVGLANAQRAGRFLFGGTESGRPPFVIENDGGSTRVVYQGNSDELQIEVAPGVQTALNLPGDRIFQNRDRQQITIAGVTGAQAGIGINTGVGEDVLSVTFAGLDVGTATGIAQGTGATTALGPLAYSFTGPDQLTLDGETFTVTGGDQTLEFADGRTLALNLTLPIAPATGTITAQANLSIDGGQNVVTTDFTSSTVQLVDAEDGTKLNLDLSNLRRTGEDRVLYEGTFDVFQTLIELRDLMTSPPDGLAQSEIGERLSSYLSRIDNAHDDLLDSLRSLGFRSANMQLLGNRVESLKATSEESLSLARDTELTSALVDFQRQELNYQAAIQVGARVVQVSLLNFL
jgi:flagellar hook-associated protein 3 FlgL